MANTTSTTKSSGHNGKTATQSAVSENLQPSQDMVAYLKEYARHRPEVAAMWCFGIGFVLGWKLKPW